MTGYHDFTYGNERRPERDRQEPTSQWFVTPSPDGAWEHDPERAADDGWQHHDEDGDDSGWTDQGWDADGGWQHDDECSEDGDDGWDPDEGCDDLAATVTRRRFLAGLAASSAAGYTAFWAMGRGGEVASVDPTTTTTPTSIRVGTTPPAETTAEIPEPAEPEVGDPSLLQPAPVDERILVLIELEGGNDGPSTVVPYASGTYYDLRPNLAVPAEAVLPIDDEVGLNPNLSRLHGRQLAVVEGVGPVDGSLSHFEMVARWEQGDLYGNQGLRTGFLARLADALDDGSPTIGLSVGGFTPRFNNVTASTLSLDDLNTLRILTDDEWIHPAYRQAVASFTGGPMTTAMANSWRHLVEIGGALPNELGGVDRESPMVKDGGSLGKQLAAAAPLLMGDVGVRVVHASLGGFDTHQGHEYKHEDLMKKLDVAVDGFLQLMADAGLAERVLVATSSEFGRRATENGNGLDHGAASTMLLWGPILPGRHGEPSPLGDLDGQGNLKTSVPFDSYLAFLAQEWLGVDAASIIPTAPQPIAGLVPAV